MTEHAGNARQDRTERTRPPEDQQGAAGQPQDGGPASGEVQQDDHDGPQGRDVPPATAPGDIRRDPKSPWLGGG